MRADRNDVRELAAKGQVARNVDALCGVIAEILKSVVSYAGIFQKELLSFLLIIFQKFSVRGTADCSIILCNCGVVCNGTIYN